MRRLDQWGQWVSGGGSDCVGYNRIQPFAKLTHAKESHDPGYFPKEIQAVEAGLAGLKAFCRLARTDHYRAIYLRHVHNMPDCALVGQLHRSQWELDALFNAAYWRLAAHMAANAGSSGRY